MLKENFDKLEIFEKQYKKGTHEYLEQKSSELFAHYEAEFGDMLINDPDYLKAKKNHELSESHDSLLAQLDALTTYIEKHQERVKLTNIGSSSVQDIETGTVVTPPMQSVPQTSEQLNQSRLS